ncbi:GGDEF domain-containing protein [Lysobacter sp. TY2-98]|uniref:putative bifunctional diguanylate cyclase/phosphodiesterase n=1 Tax=Lysobacter sp. TY2-98 TaxID=2290922 RepID=UPI000E20A9F3|nr:GGDEF domain-containing phosphodiesterase [Lysobacter sp. TY2-98]AXK71146.1 GGDEF domain-containing protein [Lysobacter sp. TY2-98]
MNRAELSHRLNARIEAGASSFAVMLVRVQRLQEFRLVHGYEASDAVGRAACERIRELLRPQDELDQVAENEFIVLLPGLMNPGHAMLAATRAVRAFETPLLFAQHAVMTPVAVGVALFPEHGNDATTLLRRAEIALRDAKRLSERCALYSPGTERAMVPYEWLHDALRTNRLEAHFEPILDLRRNAVCGYESLARWHDPDGGPIRPDVFIRLAEDTGLIAELTRWSLNATFRHAAAIRSSEQRLRFSVNISPRVFGQRDLVQQITGALAVWDMPPDAVTLEVTESALMEDPLTSIAMLHTLRDAGLAISIDDFGAGYSSLAYLKQLPATELKIDRSFVADMRHDLRSARVVRAIIDLGHQLDLQVVAEGVEDAETLEVLRALGCDRAQGYHIGRSTPASFLLDRVAPA